VCERGRLTRTEHDGRIAILADSFDGKGLHWPNDVVVRSDGTIFFTDLKQKTEWANPAKTNRNAVYALSTDNRLTLSSTECETPNGIALSLKQDILYVADTERGNIRKYELNGEGTRSGTMTANGTLATIKAAGAAIRSFR
jgi:gluconolactonase